MTSTAASSVNSLVIKSNIVSSAAAEEEISTHPCYYARTFVRSLIDTHKRSELPFTLRGYLRAAASPYAFRRSQGLTEALSLLALQPPENFTVDQSTQPDLELSPTAGSNFMSMTLQTAFPRRDANLVFAGIAPEVAQTRKLSKEFLVNWTTLSDLNQQISAPGASTSGSGANFGGGGGATASGHSSDALAIEEKARLQLLHNVTLREQELALRVAQGLCTHYPDQRQHAADGSLVPVVLEAINTYQQHLAVLETEAQQQYAAAMYGSGDFISVDSSGVVPPPAAAVPTSGISVKPGGVSSTHSATVSSLPGTPTSRDANPDKVATSLSLLGPTAASPSTTPTTKPIGHSPFSRQPSGSTSLGATVNAGGPSLGATGTSAATGTGSNPASNTSPAQLRVLLAMIDAVEAACHYCAHSLTTFVNLHGVKFFLLLAQNPFAPLELRRAVLHFFCLLVNETQCVQRLEQQQLQQGGPGGVSRESSPSGAVGAGAAGGPGPAAGGGKVGHGAASAVKIGPDGWPNRASASKFYHSLVDNLKVIFTNRASSIAMPGAERGPRSRSNSLAGGGVVSATGGHVDPARETSTSLTREGSVATDAAAASNLNAEVAAAIVSLSTLVPLNGTAVSPHMKRPDVERLVQRVQKQRDANMVQFLQQIELLPPPIPVPSTPMLS